VCVASERVRLRLSGPDGQLHPQLAPILELLDIEAKPRSTLTWLHHSQWGKELGKIAAEHAVISHAVLDAHPPSQRIVHLRGMLMYAGVLPERVEYIESTVPWVERFLADQPEDIAAVIRRYATWSVLRRARHRAQQREPSRATTKYTRNMITLAAQLLGWLASQHLTLATMGQRDLDRWLATGSENRRRVRDFVRWTHAQGLSVKLHIPVASRTQPGEFLDEGRRWEMLSRCAHDDSLDTEVRVAAALVLLFGLTPTRISRLTTQDVIDRHGHTYLAVGACPLTLPPTIAALTAHLVAKAVLHRPRILDDPRQVNEWLFPGHIPGRHAQPTTLTERMFTALGLRVRVARNAALCSLAQDIPASVLAQLLGMQIEAAVRWSALVKPDWAAYLAARQTARSPGP
jgi:hypothetical protein